MYYCRLPYIQDFNTSHVSINHFPINSQAPTICNFNTSHVSINRDFNSEVSDSEANFNTSHVSINRTALCARGDKSAISIHLMFLLISQAAQSAQTNLEFQYISCFY